MKKIFHPASSRGAADHGWLQAKHSFSFANYYDSERVQFGALRVLNDDIIAPGMGFGTHLMIIWKLLPFHLKVL